MGYKEGFIQMVNLICSDHHLHANLKRRDVQLHVETVFMTSYLR